MKKLRRFFTLACVTFTMNILLVMLIPMFTVTASFTYRELTNFFILHIVIAFSVFIIDKFIVNNIILNRIIVFVVVAGWVLGLGGGVFGFFEVNLLVIGIILFMEIAIFLIALWAIYAEEKSAADMINKKIKEKNL